MKWIKFNTDKENSFNEFLVKFQCDKKNAKLRISSDFRYVAYINGEFASNGQYADLPDYKSVNEADVSCLIKSGENILKIVAWHSGRDFSICRSMPASVAFEIVGDGKTIVCSDENTLCRAAVGYKAGDIVTFQIGYGFNYDFTDEGEEYKNAELAEVDFRLIKRPVENLVISKPLASEIVAQGVFKTPDSVEGLTTAGVMRRSWIKSLGFSEMTGLNRTNSNVLNEKSPLVLKAEGGDGIFFIVDLGRETAGHLDFSVEVDNDCKMSIGWGEHLTDLRVRTEIDGRNFASEFILKKGANDFTDYLRRIGCRYICAFVYADCVKVGKLTVMESSYPFKKPKKDFGDTLLNRIYEVGRRTLELCAHEHYEDCPWREQALYGMDSRNQMLFGYGAFDEYEYPRAAIKLMARSMRKDGFLQLCSPSETPITIPSFTAYWLIAIAENAKADYNTEFVAEMLPYAEKSLRAFIDNTDGEGVGIFVKTPFWNFHEWSDGLMGWSIFRENELSPAVDCNLTMLVYIAAKGIVELMERQNYKGAEVYKNYYERLSRIIPSFLDKEKMLYASYVKDGEKIGYHAYTQALALVSGIVADSAKPSLCNALKNPQGKVTDLTFAALQLKYDALISCGEKQFCIDEIKRVFGKMLFNGATSFYETEYGEADFADAGSLCHGWSSVACYVFDKYLQSK